MKEGNISISGYSDIKLCERELQKKRREAKANYLYTLFIYFEDFLLFNPMPMHDSMLYLIIAAGVVNI